MRNFYLYLLACALLFGCTQTSETPPSDTPAPELAASGLYFRSAAEGEALYWSIVKSIEPQVEGICNELSSAERDRFCDFNFRLIENSTLPPNAYQSLNSRGRPIIAFNINLTRALKNKDEFAFVIGHEAGHQIATHIERQRVKATTGREAGRVSANAIGWDPRRGASIGAEINALSVSKAHEFEADKIGTHITYRTGYNPEVGIGYFRRVESGSNGLLSTHPPSDERIARVEAEYQRILKSGGSEPLNW